MHGHPRARRTARSEARSPPRRGTTVPAGAPGEDRPPARSSPRGRSFPDHARMQDLIAEALLGRSAIRPGPDLRSNAAADKGGRTRLSPPSSGSHNARSLQRADHATDRGRPGSIARWHRREQAQAPSGRLGPLPRRSSACRALARFMRAAITRLDRQGFPRSTRSPRRGGRAL